MLVSVQRTASTPTKVGHSSRWVPASALALVLASGWAPQAMAQTAPAVNTSYQRFDERGLLLGTIAGDPDGTGTLPFLATRNTYDGLGRLIRVETGTLTVWQADTVRPANWPGFKAYKTVNIGYDGRSRKNSETTSGEGAAAALTHYAYDSLDRLTCSAVRMNLAAFGAVVDACVLGPEGSQGPDRITRNQYDNLDRLERVKQAVGTSLEQTYASYTYNDDDKRTSLTDAKGNLATMAYDGFARQTRWTFPSETAVGQVNANDFEEYGYDANSNRTSLRRRDGRTLTFGYDALNRMTSKLVPDGCAPIQRGGCTPASATRDVHYGYDLRGLQTFARFDSASGDGVTNTYDGFGDLTSSRVTMAGYSRTLSHLYDADANRTRLTHPDGTYFTTAYDGLDRMKSASWWTSAGGTVPFLIVTYDAAGRRNDITRGSSRTVHGYDGDGRLAVMHQRFYDAIQDVTAGFEYNPASQIVRRTRNNDTYAFTGHVNVNRGYAVNGLNQYTSAGPASFQFDVNGNLITDGTTNYLYDAENRLVLTSTGLSLTYDPLGRLWQTSGGSASLTQFLYDGDKLVGEYGGSGQLLRRYAHGPGIDEPIVWSEGAAMTCPSSRFLHSDHQGSVIAFADCWGARMAPNSFEEYGIPAPANQGRFQYTGQAWIPELGMYHYKARVYSPTLGRFLQTDPIGYDDQVNLYAYVGNDPVNMNDPSGQDAIYVRERDGTVTVIVPIKVSGAMSTTSSGAAIAAEAAKWKVDNGGVKFEVRPTQTPIEGVLNFVEIGNGPNTAMCGAAGECTNELGGNRVYINGKNRGSVAAATHDVVGHGSGIDDGYVELPPSESGTRRSTIRPGYSADNAMSTRGGTRITQSQMQEVRDNDSTITRCRDMKGELKRC